MAKYAVRIVIDKLSEDENDYETLLNLGEEDMVGVPGGVLAAMLVSLAAEISPPPPPKNYYTSGSIYGGVIGGTGITPASGIS